MDLNWRTYSESPNGIVVCKNSNLLARRRIRREAKKVTDRVTARQESTLTEQRNILRKRLHAWEEILPIYMPGLLQYRHTLESSPQSTPTPATDHPEDAVIWLPSRIPKNLRARVCTVGLAEIEEKIRTAHCHDSLDAVRRVLNIKSRMVAFKNKNVRGQRDGLRSRTIIDRVHERARVAAERYWSARRGLLALAGPGDWEKTLRVLNDGDIRGYQDPERLRVRPGRKGTLEDGQVAAAQAVEEDRTEEDNGMSDDVEESTSIWRPARREMALERRVACSHGYGRPIREAQIPMTTAMRFFVWSGRKAGHEQPDVKRKFSS